MILNLASKVKNSGKHLGIEKDPQSVRQKYGIEGGADHHFAKHLEDP